MLISLDANFSVNPESVTGIAVTHAGATPQDAVYRVTLSFCESNSYTWTLSSQDPTVSREAMEEEAQKFADSLRVKVNQAFATSRRL